MRQAIALLICCFAHLATASPITAEVRIDRYTYAPEIVHAGDRDLHAGQYTGTIDRDDATAWCAELTQWMQFGAVKEYQIVSAEDAYGAETASRLRQLLSWTYFAGEPSNAAASAALQSDIWRIIDGSLPIADYTSAPISVRAVVLHHNNWQDLLIGAPLVAVPVDEPDPGIPLSLGVGFIAGYLATRRRTTGQPSRREA